MTLTELLTALKPEIEAGTVTREDAVKKLVSELGMHPADAALLVGEVIEEELLDQ